MRSNERRHGQAVRQRSATPLSPVRFRVAPPKTKNQSVRTGFLFFASSPVGPALCARRTESGSKDSRCRWHLEIPGVPFRALEGPGMALFFLMERNSVPFLFFASSPVGAALCARRTESGSKDSRCRGHLEIPGVLFRAPEGPGMALFVRIARFCFAIFGSVKYLVLALSCGTFLQKLSYNVTGTLPNMIRQGDYYGTIYQSGPIVI